MPAIPEEIDDPTPAVTDDEIVRLGIVLDEDDLDAPDGQDGDSEEFGAQD